MEAPTRGGGIRPQRGPDLQPASDKLQRKVLLEIKVGQLPVGREAVAEVARVCQPQEWDPEKQ